MNSSNPMLTMMVLVTLNGSQNQTKRKAISGAGSKGGCGREEVVRIHYTRASNCERIKINQENNRNKVTTNPDKQIQRTCYKDWRNKIFLLQSYIRFMTIYRRYLKQFYTGIRKHYRCDNKNTGKKQKPY